MVDHLSLSPCLPSSSPSQFLLGWSLLLLPHIPSLPHDLLLGFSLPLLHCLPNTSIAAALAHAKIRHFCGKFYLGFMLWANANVLTSQLDSSLVMFPSESPSSICQFPQCPGRQARSQVYFAIACYWSFGSSLVHRLADMKRAVLGSERGDWNISKSKCWAFVTGLDVQSRRQSDVYILRAHLLEDSFTAVTGHATQGDGQSLSLHFWKKLSYESLTFHCIGRDLGGWWWVYWD